MIIIMNKNVFNSFDLYYLNFDHSNIPHRLSRLLVLVLRPERGRVRGNMIGEWAPGDDHEQVKNEQFKNDIRPSVDPKLSHAKSEPWGLQWKWNCM